MTTREEKQRQKTIEADANSLVGPMTTFVGRAWHGFAPEAYDMAAKAFEQYEQDEANNGDVNDAAIYAAAAAHMRKRASRTRANLETFSRAMQERIVKEAKP